MNEDFGWADYVKDHVKWYRVSSALDHSLSWQTINAIKAHNRGRITTVQSINSGCPFKEQADKSLAYCRSLWVRGMKSPALTGNGCRASQGCWQCQPRTVEAGEGPLQRHGFSFPGQTSVLCLLEISTAQQWGQEAAGSGPPNTPGASDPSPARHVWNRLPLITALHREPGACLQGRRCYHEKIPAGRRAQVCTAQGPDAPSAAPLLGPGTSRWPLSPFFPLPLANPPPSLPLSLCPSG